MIQIYSILRTHRVHHRIAYLVRVQTSTNTNLFHHLFMLANEMKRKINSRNTNTPTTSDTHTHARTQTTCKQYVWQKQFYQPRVIYKPLPVYRPIGFQKTFNYNYGAAPAAYLPAVAPAPAPVPVQQIPIPQPQPVLYHKRIQFQPITYRKEVIE